MTAIEILIKNKVFTSEDVNKSFNLQLTRDAYVGTQNDIVKTIEEYAKLKCEELLKIVAEKAKIETEKKSQHGKHRKWQKVKEDEEFNLFDYIIRTSIDKNSILNAVDLNEFIK